MKNQVIWLLLTAFLFGCATTKTVVEPGLPALALKEAAIRRTTRGITASLTLPAGIYRPAFRDKDGIYYQPESPMIILGHITPRSYVFVSAADPRKHAYWLEGYAVVDWFDSPLPFEVSALK